MKFIKWKSMIFTCVVCLLPIVLGIAFWDALPETMAVHFDMHNNPDGFAPKGVVVFCLPVLMAILQMICCFIQDANMEKYGKRAKFEKVTKWMLPCIVVVLQVVTLGYALGWDMDVRKIAAWLVGGLFLVSGICLPKLDYIKNKNVDKKTALKINRIAGYASVVMGILFLLSSFFAPQYTVACLLLLIPYAVVLIVCGIRAGRD